jgi:uncharacterized protein
MSLTLTLLHGDYSVVQYAAGTPLTAPSSADFWSLSTSAREVSLVCASHHVPLDYQKIETGWRVFRFEGPFDFALTGILASVANPLAQAGVGIFALSTFDTDYVLVKAAQLETAITALRAAGHTLILP